MNFEIKLVINGSPNFKCVRCSKSYISSMSVSIIMTHSPQNKDILLRSRNGLAKLITCLWFKEHSATIRKWG